jgi:hypothetical protein
LVLGDTSLGIRPALAGVTRVPGAGKLASGVLVRIVIQPVLVPLFGSVKLPENVAPAARTIVSPGWAALIAFWTFPPAGTVMVLPLPGAYVVSR